MSVEQIKPFVLSVWGKIQSQKAFRNAETFYQQTCDFAPAQEWGQRRNSFHQNSCVSEGCTFLLEKITSIECLALAQLSVDSISQISDSLSGTVLL